jgi:transcription-repair coupling factor (superfamily II helicase)
MLGYFPSQTNTAYYQSASFGNVLDFIKNNPQIGSLSEKNGKLRLTFEKIHSVEDAKKVLEKV